MLHHLFLPLLFTFPTSTTSITTTPCTITNDPELSSPLLLSSTYNYTMQNKFNETTQTITVVLTASATLPGYIGFGFPEQTSGSMVGADLVTIVFDSTTGKATATDRFVPWTSFPFYPYGGEYLVASGYSIPVNTIFPTRDCENNGTNDWQVLWVQQTSKCKQVAIQRSYNTTDANDRPVPIGSARFLWSMGTNDSIEYHGANRGTSTAMFRPAVVPTPAPCPTCFTVDLRFGPNYPIPVLDTTYACQSFNFSNSMFPQWESGQTFTLTKIEPLVQPGNEAYVHHIVANGCSGTQAALVSSDLSPVTCAITSTVGLPCNNVLWAWAVGGTPLIIPDGVGFVYKARTDQSDDTMFAMSLQMHYTNVGLVKNVLDNSGMRFTFKPGSPTYAAGTFELGNVALYWPDLPKGESSIHRQATCPSLCTANLAQPLNVFASFVHTHETGKAIWTSVFDKNGNYRYDIERTEFWSFTNQLTTPVQVQIHPGDRLQTHAVWDTSSSTRDIEFGEDSFKEMALHFITVYPMPAGVSSGTRCGSAYNNGVQQTVCGGGGHANTYNASFQVWDDPNTVPGANPNSSFAPYTPGGNCEADTTALNALPGYGGGVTAAGMNIYWKFPTTTTGSSVSFRVESTSSSWIGLGVQATKPDGGNAMVGSTAVIGSTSFSPSCGVYYLGATDINAITKVDPPTASGLEKCTYQAPEPSTSLYVLEFTVTRLGDHSFVEPSSSSGRRRLNAASISNIVKMVVARGGSPDFAQHVDQAAISVDLTSGAAVVDDTSGTMRLAHACLMVIAVVVIAPMGIFFPAFVKWGYVDVCKQHWLRLHQMFMLCAGGCMIIALGLVVPTVAQPLSSPHHIVGTIVIALFLFNPILGFLRPHPAKAGEVRTPKRLAFEIIHKTCGRTGWTLGVCNVFLGWYYHGSLMVPPASSMDAVEDAFSVMGAVGVTTIVMYVVVKVMVWHFKGRHNKLNDVGKPPVPLAQRIDEEDGKNA